MANVSSGATLTDALNESPLDLFHLRAVLTSGMGFFTDAYDLFIIGTASTVLATQWHLSASQVGLVNSATLLAAFAGAFVFGRLADAVGRKRIYGLEATLMVIGALISALAPNYAVLIAGRVILGVGVGGDYPVSAVLMSEFANRKDRGKLVGLVFSMQALGLIVGPMVGLTLVATKMAPDLSWRLMLGLGAIPAAIVIYFRRRMPESPRYMARVAGDTITAATSMARYSEGAVNLAEVVSETPRRMGLGTFLTNPRYLRYLVGTAGTWFVFDYAYYGNSVSAPLIVKTVLGASKPPLTEVLALNLIIFVVAAVPGYLLATFTMDRIGHRLVQLIGFPLMGAAFLLIGIVPGITGDVVPFLLLFGVSYFFAEFGPNTTTFVLAAEIYPVSQRTTGHGISAGLAKLGAFIGVYLFPVLLKDLGLAGAMELSAGFAAVGTLLTLLLPEPSGQTLEALSLEESDGSDRIAQMPVMDRTA
jgi:PHS family inorganic phosphate transporter-like MFS transporter